MIENTTAFGHDPDQPANPQPVAAETLVGRTLNNAYRVEAVLGTGGMGVVYQATQLALGRPVAVKTILGPSATDQNAVQRFFREAKLLSKLSHPNVIQVIDFGTATPGPIHFMVMEFLVGQTLDQFVAASPPVPVETVVALMAQMCAGVTAAHAAGIVHRDLKPTNVYLSAVTGSPHPVVKVLDFGLAKAVSADAAPSSVTVVGTMLGTTGFSSPEQMQGHPSSDPRSDVYGLGAILHYLVSGKPPYSGQTFQTVLAKQLTQPPEPLDPVRVGAEVVRAFDPVIRKAMALDPADRYATVAEFQAAVTRAGRLAPPSRAVPIPPMPPSRGRRAIAVLAAAVLAAGVVGWLALRPKPGPPGAAPPNPGATAPGVTSDQVVFGMSGPFSGPSKELGRGVRVGIELAFRPVNDGGGVFGRALKLEVRDDGYDPDRAAANTTELLEQTPVFAFAGSVGTPTCEKALPLVAGAGRVFFAPYTGARFLRKVPPDRHVFNYRAGYDEETAVIVRYLLTDRQIRPNQIAVFSQNDGYGDAGYAGVERALKKAGHDPKAALHVRYDRATNDVGPAVREVLAKRDGIKAVVMVATYKPAAAFIRRLKDEKLDAVFTNVSFVGGTSFADALREYGPGYPDGVVVTQVVPHPLSNGTAVRRYRDLLKKYHPEMEPGFVSLEGYLAGTILAKGVADAGPNLTTEGLVDALEGLRDFDLGTGTPVRYSLSDHQASHAVWGTVLDAEGKFKELDLD